MEITLRESTPADLDRLLELRAVVLRADLERLGRYDPVRVRERMRDAFDPAATLIIAADGIEVGCIAVRREPEARWIEHFYLAPEAQGRGIGARVLESVLAGMRPEPAPPIRLNVLRGSRARGLYERAGFAADSEDEVDVFMTLHAPSRAAETRSPGESQRDSAGTGTGAAIAATP